VCVRERERQFVCTKEIQTCVGARGRKSEQEGDRVCARERETGPKRERMKERERKSEIESKRVCKRDIERETVCVCVQKRNTGM